MSLSMFKKLARTAVSSNGRLFSTSRSQFNDIVQHATTTTVTQSISFDQQAPRRNRFADRENQADQARQAQQQRNVSRRKSPYFQVTENLSMRELNRVRTLPTLSTFYGGNPVHEQNINQIKHLLRKYDSLPTRVLTNEELAQNKFIGFEEYKERTQSGTRTNQNSYKELISGLNRLRNIDLQLMPVEVIELLNKYYSTSVGRITTQRKLKELDHLGRALSSAKRKSSEAKVYLVKGDGQVMINGKNMIEYFGNIYARKNIVYPFQVVEQEGKYNVFATVSGGGYTGQSEAVMYAIAKCLVIFNPLLKPRLRKAGLMTSDSRVVERKKPGKLKARKSPTWVKR
ncbi:mitochondrial 37S ribosomal protein uS9m [Lodderomyces beijingensis]|uniref:Small ribosomal subunit protein uS9m n=1 Tax=Lodderomyces beijingensis TaxID=1775926 RepID=A0ABP0ZG31_9ASCO